VTIDEAAIREAVTHLITARRERRAIGELPEGCRPATPEEAYAIQEAFIDSWDEHVAGWKVGATAPAALQTLRLDEPFWGPVFSPAILQSPAEAVASTFHTLLLECEFAFRIGRDLPARAAPFERERVVEAVQGLVPAIEVVSSRYGDLAGPGGLQVIADCGANGALVLGEEHEDWQGFDLRTHRVRLEVDGAQVAEGTGAAVLGHPLESLTWFVNRRAERGFGLRPGEVVSTGTCTGMTPVEAGKEAVADFGPLGLVRVRFVA